jgi:hypothetical protein
MFHDMLATPFGNSNGEDLVHLELVPLESLAALSHPRSEVLHYHHELAHSYGADNIARDPQVHFRSSYNEWELAF